MALAALSSCGLLDTENPEPKSDSNAQSQSQPMQETKLPLGAFSVSLAVKDLAASRAFYEKLGFVVTGGDPAQNWLVLRSGTTTVGLFQGMFDNNLMTFNPGWNSQAQPIGAFTDVREIQAHLKKNGLKLISEVDESTNGPAHFTLSDPDGNTILFDQHVK